MAILSPEKYYKKPEESVAEYNARVAAESQIGDTGYASLTQGQKDLLSSVPLKGETAILGTPSAKNNFETKIQPKIDAANNSLKAATEIITNPKTKPTLEEPIIPSELLDEGKTPEEIEQEKLEKKQRDNWEKQQTNIEETYKGLTTVQTTSDQNQIAGLTKQWQERKNLMEKSNKAALAGFTQYFQRTGGAEYSPLITQEFISTKEQEGADRLTEIDNEYNAKIGEINNALSNNLFSVAAAKTKDLLALEEKSIQQMKENTKAAKEVNDKLKEETQKINNEITVNKLFVSGITEAEEIQGFLKDNGIIMSLDEINKSLKIINPDKSLAGLDTDIKSFKAFFPNVDIKTEKGRQAYLDWQAQVANATRKADKLSATEKIRDLKTVAFSKASPFLEQSRGEDGYIDPDVYMRLRSDYAEVIGNPSDFDDVFASYLSPQERARLGVGKAVGLKVADFGKADEDNPY